MYDAARVTKKAAKLIILKKFEVELFKEYLDLLLLRHLAFIFNRRVTIIQMLLRHCPQ